MHSRFQAKSSSPRSSLYKAGRTVGLFSLILAPLLAGLCLHSTLAETDPHVFFITRHADSQASLVILGAVDSVSRMEPPGKIMIMMMVEEEEVDIAIKAAYYGQDSESGPLMDQTVC